MPLTLKRRSRRPRHQASCRHCPRVRLLGQEFRLWREAWDLAGEAVHAGYPTEAASWSEANTPPTFRRYLETMAGTGWPMSGQAPRRWAA